MILRPLVGQQVTYPLLAPQTRDAPPEEVIRPLARAPIALALRCRGKQYTLGARQGAAELAAASLSAADLTAVPAQGAPFAGVLFGVYSFGSGEPVLDPADFTEIVVQEGDLDVAGWEQGDI